MATLDPLRRSVIDKAKRTQRAAANRMADDLERAAPKDTRQLSRSIKVGRQTGTTTISTVIKVDPRRSPSKPDNVDVAGFNEYGTRPHVIRPKRGKALRFQTGGRVVFARRVNHPGTPARPWFYPTLRQWPETVRRTWRGSA